MGEGSLAPQFPERLNLAQHLLDARIAEGRGGNPALLTPELTHSYADVLAQANRLAHVLRDAGVRKGDRVLLALPDGPAFVAAFFATLKLGAVGAMANPDVPVDEHEYLLAITGARALLASAAVAGRARAAIRQAKGLAVCLVDSEIDDEFPSLNRACAGAPATFTNEDTHQDDVALWLFTSGSTGRPKAAVHRHRDFAYHIECYARGVLGLHAGDVVLSVPKLHFPYATGMSLMFPFAVGASAILFPEHPTPDRLFALVARHRPTILTTVPTMTAKLLAVPGGDLSSLRLAVSAGEALPVDLYHRWRMATGVQMLDGIGSAEMFHIYISNRPGDVQPGSLGRVVPGYRARVVRVDGSDADDGEAGTLWVTGGSTMLGYHADPDATAAVLRDGWVVSGDFFRRSADGSYHYEGRSDDMLKVGGIYVSPLEVENTIAAHPAVAECAVVGAPDELGLVKPRAFVVPAPGCIADERLFGELTAWTRERLAHYKVPRSWQARESLPRNDRGKIVRRLLRG